MHNIYIGQKVKIVWTILKGLSQERESFDRANVRVFLTQLTEGDNMADKIHLIRKNDTEGYHIGYYEQTKGIISIELDNVLTPGVYGVKAIWSKNDGRSVVYSEKSLLFAVTDNREEAENPDASRVEITVKSSTATYGLDGLSAYETAVMHDLTTYLTEKEWVQVRSRQIETNQIKDGAVTTAKIANEAVTTDKIPDEAIASYKIADEAVTERKIADAAVTTEKLENDSVTNKKIADWAVTTEKLAEGAVMSADIAEGAVITQKIANGAVTTEKIRNGAVTTSKIGDGEVKSANIANGAVVAEKIEDGCIDGSKIADRSITGQQIADKVIVGDHIANGAISSEKFADGGISAHLLEVEKSVVEANENVKNAEEYAKGIYDAISKLPEGITQMDAKVIKNEADISVLKQQINNVDADWVIYDKDKHYKEGSVGKAIGNISANTLSYDPNSTYSSGTVGKALKDLDGVAGDAERAEAAATSAASSASAIQSALDKIKGSGDIPAATVAQVVENTADISQLAQKVPNIVNIEEYISITTDNDNKILEAIDKDGNRIFFIPCVFKDGVMINDTHINSMESPEYMCVKVSKNNKILEAIDKDGNKLVFGNLSVGGTLNAHELGSELISLIKEAAKPTLKGKLRLPNNLHICSGCKSRIYANAMVYDSYPEDYHVDLAEGTYTIEPNCIVGDSVGVKTWNIKLRNKDGVVSDEKSFNIHTFAPPTNNVSLKILHIGDSKSATKDKFAELHRLLNKDGKVAVEYIGTRTSTGYDAKGNTMPISNEGVSGKTLWDFLTQSDVSGNNIFYDSSLSTGINVQGRNREVKEIKFSIAHAINALGQIPDILWIDMGKNEEWDYYYPDESIIACYDYVVNNVKQYNIQHGTNIKVVISDQENDSLRETITAQSRTIDKAARKIKLYTKRFEDRESEGIFLCPNWLFVDLYNDYTLAEVPMDDANPRLHLVTLDLIHPGITGSSYNNSTKYKYGDAVITTGRNVFVCCNVDGVQGVTPNDDKINWAKADNVGVGYWHIAQAYYHTINYIVSLM